MSHPPSSPARPFAIDEDEGLKIPRVATVLGVCTRTVEREISAGRLPSIRVGRSRRIRKSDLEEYMWRSSTGSCG